MFQEFPENNKDDDFLNEFRQRLANQANAKLEEKQKDLQRSKSVFLGAIAGVGLACVVGWFILSPQNKNKMNEELPVVRKPQAAVKIKPTEPGGMEILNQDKTVYDIIDKSADNKSNVEQLLPPPEEPKLPEITPETVATTVAEAETITEIIDNIEGGQTVVEEIVEAKTIIEEAPEAKTITIAEATKEIEVKTIETPKPEPKVQPKVTEKERDYLLPEDRKQTEKTEPKKEVVDNSKPTSAPAGTWQIQLMSSKNKAAVEKSWAPTVKKYPVLTGLSYEIEEADLDFDGLFYRLKAGAFSNKADADKVCNEIKAKGGSCLVKKK